MKKKVKDLVIGDRIENIGLVIRLMREDHKGYKNHRRVTCSEHGSSITYVWSNEMSFTLESREQVAAHSNHGDRHSGWSV